MRATDYILALLSSAAVSAALTAVLFWIMKNWITERLKNAIKHEYDVKLESHKAQVMASLNTEIETHKARLQIDNTTAIERLKADLQIATSEHQVRFARLHEKVAKSVAGMHLRLTNLAIAVGRYTAVFETPSMGSKVERRKAIADALKNFDDYFKTRKLYVSKELAQRIKALVDRLYGLTVDFMHGVEKGGDESFPDRDTWTKVDNAMRNEAKPLLEALEDEFRSLLGVQ